MNSIHCYICYEQNKIIQTHCGQSICQQCVSHIIEVKEVCPFCRYEGDFCNLPDLDVTLTKFSELIYNHKLQGCTFIFVTTKNANNSIPDISLAVFEKTYASSSMFQPINSFTVQINNSNIQLNLSQETANNYIMLKLNSGQNLPLSLLSYRNQLLQYRREKP